MTPITPTTPEHLRQLLMTYQVQSTAGGMWVISHPHFSGGHPWPIFATASLPDLIAKLEEVLRTDAEHGPGAYAERVGNGHFAQMFRHASASLRHTNTLLDELEIDL